jgi:23S rRNA (uracil1939-C5)-methyltransferase
MTRKKLPLLNKIEITDIGSRGKAIARVDDFVTFVDNALPGDVVDIRLKKRKKSFQEGIAVHFHSRSEQRADPFCAHFGHCGGCRWQDLKYESQLIYKQKEVTDNLQRIGKLDIPDVLPILPSPKQQHYRNKLEFTFSNRRWLLQEELDSGEEIIDRNGLGFHITGMFDKVIDLKECYLQEEPSNRIRHSVREYARDHNLAFYDLRNRRGLLRNLIIRNSTAGELMVILVFFEDDRAEIEGLMNHLDKEFPEITSLMYCFNSKANDSIFDLEFHLYSGRDHILEKMEDLQFKIGPKSFFQTNSLQALELYRKVREFAALTGRETVYDLYSGTGSIGLFLAGNAEKVIGIEYIDEAVRDSRGNAELNRLGNTRFYSGDIKEVLTNNLVNSEGRPDVIIADPPRTGMHKDVVKAVLSAGASRIVYISCNPATQARDLAILSDRYKILNVQPVDMFPHTFHVENIVLLG